MSVVFGSMPEEQTLFQIVMLHASVVVSVCSSLLLACLVSTAVGTLVIDFSTSPHLLTRIIPESKNG